MTEKNAPSVPTGLRAALTQEIERLKRVQQGDSSSALPAGFEINALNCALAMLDKAEGAAERTKGERS